MNRADLSSIRTPRIDAAPTAQADATAAPDAVETSPAIDIGRSPLQIALFDGDASETARLVNDVRRDAASLEDAARALHAPHPNGRSGLHSAMRRGHGDAVRAFGAGLRQFGFGDATLTRLLEARDEHGNTALNRAIFEQRPDAVRAFFEVVADQTLAARPTLELLAARQADGTPGLAPILAWGDVDTLRAYAHGLADLLARVRREHDALVPIARLLPALQTGDRSATQVLRARHRVHAREILGDDVLALFSARDTEGRPALALVPEGSRRDAAFRAFERAVDGLGLPGLEPQAMAALREEVTAFDGPPGPVRFFTNPISPPW